MTLRIHFLTAAMIVAFVSAAFGQGTEVAFGQGTADSNLPVEVTADLLRVDQVKGTAVFVGNVLVGQGEMRLSADQVDVQYEMVDGKSTGKIAQVVAKGGVTFVNGPEAAEGDLADYDVINQKLLMTGNVILTQNKSILSGERLSVNMVDGTGVMEGRVKTILENSDK